MPLGWMLPPSWLSWALIGAKAIEDAGSEVAGQLALADFIVRGEFERHLRRMRLHYRQRRAKLLATMARELPAWTPMATVDGLYLTAVLPDQLDEPALLAAAARPGRRSPPSTAFPCPPYSPTSWTSRPCWQPLPAEASASKGSRSTATRAT